MNTTDTIERLRAARPMDRPSAGHDDLLARILGEPGDPRLTHATWRSTPRLTLKRPRVLAGGSLGLAGIAAAATLAFTGGAAAPAFAVTRAADGTILVTVNAKDASTPWVIPADRTLAEMGVHEQINVATAAGPASSGAPVACESVAGPGTGYGTPSGYEPVAPSGPEVKVAFGNDGTVQLPAGGTGSGTMHLVSCVYYPVGAGTQMGNSGTKFLDANGGQ